MSTTSANNSANHTTTSNTQFNYAETQSSYNFQAVESFWQGQWYRHNIYATEDFSDKPKKYILVEFPFPSGERLHLGHCFRYTMPDTYARFLRMRGYNVLFPIGWDAFGLPTEEHARKHNKSPQETTRENVAGIREDLQKMGFSFDWQREFATTDPDFYKWTQWMVGLMWEQGLLEQQEIELWWCPELNCVLANEEVVEVNNQKVSERGGHPVVKRKMKQWVIKITEYAEKLLEGLETLNWPEHIKEMQRNWIGKSEGVEVFWEVL